MAEILYRAPCLINGEPGEMLIMDVVEGLAPGETCPACKLTVRAWLRGDGHADNCPHNPARVLR